MKWSKMSNHHFQSRNGEKSKVLTLWARVDDYGHTMYQIYNELNIDMTKLDLINVNENEKN